jgi:hypothetical protein
VCGGYGQTAERQFDGLADLGEALAAALKQPVETLWDMQNGYLLPDYYSGATGIPGRFSEGLLLRCSQTYPQMRGGSWWA